MDLGFAGKTVIVTGGGSNIGRQICLSFARENMNVVIAELDKVQGDKVAAEIEKLGGIAISIKTDVTDNNSVEEMVRIALEKFEKVDILVNNVGWNFDEFFIDEKRDKWNKVIAINFLSVLNCTRAVLDQMIERNRGVVVNIGSDAGRVGEFREAVYSGCKGGVIAFTKALAKEIGKFGIRLNVVCPGVTVPEGKEVIGEQSLWAGGMLDIFNPEVQAKVAKSYPLRKLGKAEDIANAVLFIASDAASHITGQTLSVSGGYSMM